MNPAWIDHSTNHGNLLRRRNSVLASLNAAKAYFAKLVAATIAESEEEENYYHEDYKNEDMYIDDHILSPATSGTKITKKNGAKGGKDKVDVSKPRNMHTRFPPDSSASSPLWVAATEAHFQNYPVEGPTYDVDLYRLWYTADSLSTLLNKVQMLIEQLEGEIQRLDTETRLVTELRIYEHVTHLESVSSTAIASSISPDFDRSLDPLQMTRALPLRSRDRATAARVAHRIKPKILVESEKNKGLSAKIIRKSRPLTTAPLALLDSDEEMLTEIEDSDYIVTEDDSENDVLEAEVVGSNNEDESHDNGDSDEDEPEEDDDEDDDEDGESDSEEDEDDNDQDEDSDEMNMGEESNGDVCSFGNTSIRLLSQQSIRAMKMSPPSPLTSPPISYTGNGFMPFSGSQPASSKKESVPMKPETSPSTNNTSST